MERALIAGLRARVLPAGTSFTAGEAATLAIAYGTVGFTAAVLHVSEGTSIWSVLGILFVVNAVTPGLAYVAVTASGGSTTAGVLSGWLVSTRFGLLASAVAPRLWPSRTKRAAAAYAAFDPNVALALREPTDSGVRRVYLASALAMVVPWWIGGVAGAAAGQAIGEPETLGLDAVFPAVLLVIVWPQLRVRSALVRALAAVAAALLLLEWTPGGVPVLVAACASLLAIAEGTTAEAATERVDEDGAEDSC